MVNMASNANCPQVIFPCAQCYVCYGDYRHLLEHLYWRHGTVSTWCNKCNLKCWSFAEHKCHVLPIYEDFNNNTEEIVDEEERESPYCYCGKNIDIPMIGCDGPGCVLQWYHFKCIGIEIPPEGDWLCPECSKSGQKQIKSYDET